MTATLVLLCIAAFAAGFIDAIVGGGGLVQTPVALILLPQFPVATVIGTLKIPAFAGTGIAASQYARKVRFNYPLLLLMMICAGLAAFAGSKLLTMVSNSFMKPFLLVVLTLVAIYTWRNKKFGDHQEKTLSARHEKMYSLTISIIIGFYDGFIGPGAGSFLVMAFVTLMSYHFVRASAHAKFINLATNFGSILFFLGSGHILLSIAIPMAVCNGIGGLLGARLALLKGNRFIRIFFLIVVTATLLRFAFDVFKPVNKVKAVQVQGAP